MMRVCLFHRDTTGGGAKAARLESAGYDVRLPSATSGSFKELRADPPDAFVVDLDRTPSQGRDIALALRSYKDTRRVPIVFVGGTTDIVAGVRQLLPDAAYTTWARAGAAVRRAVRTAPPDPVVPSRLAGYAGAPLSKKLGIGAGSIVWLIGAPDGFEAVLGVLPPGAKVRRRTGRHDLALWTPRDVDDLGRDVRRIGMEAGAGGLWIAWRKGKDGRDGRLTQISVRKAGLAAGLVDYKIASIDATWSGLKFRRRPLDARKATSAKGDAR